MPGAGRLVVTACRYNRQGGPAPAAGWLPGAGGSRTELPPAVWPALYNSAGPSRRL